VNPQNSAESSCEAVETSEFSFGPFAGGDAVAEYVSRYRRTDLPPLEVGAALDLYPARVAPATFIPQLTWEHPWPFNNRAGVYMIYDETLQLMYIGKVSMSRFFGHRLYEYFGNGDTCTPKMEWLHPARFVINIAVPEEMPFEAPALEEFLIRKLQPPCNGTGK
jgi:hypothetical protein